MDVEDSASEIGQSGGEIDQNLLLQFSCMNTTDKEELISQMQRLLGPSVNYNTASFFLDMSNWNLQAAICCYLDFSLPQILPSMSCKAAQTQESAIGPLTYFEQNWTIANTGAEVWPEHCKIIQGGGEPFNAPPIYVAPLPPGHTVNITLQLLAPSTPGVHRGFFHMVNDKNQQIGDVLWVQINVESEETMALADQLAALPIPSNPRDDSISQVSQDDQMC